MTVNDIKLLSIKFIEFKQEINSYLDEMLIQIESFKEINYQQTFSRLGFSFLSGTFIVKIIKALAFLVDNIGDIVLSLFTYIFYFYNYWKIIIGTLKLPSDLFFYILSLFDKWRDKRAAVKSSSPKED